MNAAKPWTTGLLAALLLLAAGAARAQQATGIGDEHYYSFRWSGELSSMQEKVLGESFSGFDPGMRLAADRPTSTLHLLAYRPLDPQALIGLAAQLGVALRDEPAAEGATQTHDR